MLELLKTVDRKVWIAFGALFLLVAFGFFYWGKSSGLEECKKA